MGLESVWNAWLAYRKGKKQSRELLFFEEHLLENLQELQADLERGTYRHGPYSPFWVKDKKKRTITVANIRDRIVHRLIYDHLVPIFDPGFLPDVWSCRKGKGLHGAVVRVEEFLRGNRSAHFWRGDIRHFFKHIDHAVLKQLIRARIKDPCVLVLIDEIIDSHAPGIPIGNLTSQIFANIYLNAFDQWVLSGLRPRAYLRYGDDFLLLEAEHLKLLSHRTQAAQFLEKALKLPLHPRNSHIGKVRQGVKFLGLDLFPAGKRIQKQSWKRIDSRFESSNCSSYLGFIHFAGSKRQNYHIIFRLSSQKVSIYSPSMLDFGHEPARSNSTSTVF